MTMPARKPGEVKSDLNVSFLWLELTGRCGLTCFHCYAASSPSGSHGVMTGADWKSAITQAADLGVPMAQFIGGCLRARRVPSGLCLVCSVR
jgi:MoaA/NifB/PqqE/SkfB family radical SAM enzyme